LTLIKYNMKSLKWAQRMNLTDNPLVVQVAAEVNAGPSTSRSDETPRTEAQRGENEYRHVFKTCLSILN
jgi:hypothetical protein